MKRKRPRHATAPARTAVIAMSANQARAFFMKPESYSSINLPPYFKFKKVLTVAARYIASHPLAPRSLKDAGKLPDVNHTMLSNKDGRHAWRPFQLIHPVLYASLVEEIISHWSEVQRRFGEFAGAESIQCCSLPLQSASKRKDSAVQILNWWSTVEQASLKLALEFNHVFHADITDCYGALYTHSVAWALHGKQIAKNDRRVHSLLGNTIDAHLTAMHYGQTNGIPQGSVLMDLIAEMVLGYADAMLRDHIKQNSTTGEYKILRYRDDYRIFVNNPQLGEEILKALTETLSDLGLKLNSSKTRPSQPVVASALKPEKWASLRARQDDCNLARHLLLIHDHGVNFPNSGQLIRMLGEFDKHLQNNAPPRDADVLIALTLDVAYTSPRAFANCAMIISRLLPALPTRAEQVETVRKIQRKMSQLPYNGHMEVWLQRICLSLAPDMQYNEKLCKAVQDGAPSLLWDSGWLPDQNLRMKLRAADVVDRAKLRRIEPIISPSEVSVFDY